MNSGPENFQAFVTSLFGILILAAVVSAVVRARAKMGASLVLTEFTVNQQAGTVDVAGRKGGSLAWLLAVLGLENRTSLHTSPYEIRFRTTSLFGEADTVLPVTQCSSVSCGYKRPIACLIVAAVLFAVALVLFLSPATRPGYGVYNRNYAGDAQALRVLGLVFGLLALVLLIAYVLRKSMYLLFVSSGGTAFGIEFRRSIIENVAVDINKVRAAVQVVSSQIVYSNARILASFAGTDAQAATPPPPVFQP